jgi:hypothetical protein
MIFDDLINMCYIITIKLWQLTFQLFICLKILILYFDRTNHIQELHHKKVTKVQIGKVGGFFAVLSQYGPF